MSTWQSGAPDTETLGDDGPAPSRRPWTTAALVVGGLVAAFALGLESRGLAVGGLSLGVDPPTLAAGALDAAPSTGPGVAFAVPVHNTGDTPVDVTAAAVPGLELLGTPSTRVAAGGWGEVSFDARIDCGEPAVAAAVVTLATSGAGDVELDLPERAFVVQELHRASCSPQQDLTPARLEGVWLVEEVFGRWAALAGRHVLRFDRDGTFVADPEGVRFISHRGVIGHYRLRGPLLDAVEEGFVGYACLPGERALWRAGQLDDGRVVLRFVRGRNCPDQPGELWLLRRLAR